VSRSRVVGRAADDVPGVSSGVRRTALSERGFSTLSAATSKISRGEGTLVSNLATNSGLLDLLHAHRPVAMDTSSLDGAGGSYLDNSIERRCQEWQASEYYNSTDSCPCLDDPDAQGQVRRTRREQRFFFVFPETLPTHPSDVRTRQVFPLGVSASSQTTCQRSSDVT
jgi:hypothetical protein